MAFAVGSRGTPGSPLQGSSQRDYAKRTGFAVAVAVAAAAAAAAVIEAAAAKDQKAMRMRMGFAAAAVAAAGIAAAAAAVAKGRKAMKMRKATPCQYTVADSIAVESQKERHPEMVENSTGPKPKCVVAISDRKMDCSEARSVLGWHTGLT